MTEKHSEKIIDAFLEELLTEQTPPDLTARITAAWERERLVSNSPLVVATPVSNAKTSQQSRLQSSTHAKLRELRERRKGASFRRNVIASLLALGACGLLAFLGSRLIVKERQVESIAAVKAGATVLEPVAKGNGLASRSEASPARAEKSTLPAAVAGPAEPLSVDNIPFALDRSSRVDNTHASAVGNALPTTRASQPLDDSAIVRSINERLSKLWRELDVTPTAVLADRERGELLARRLTGGELASPSLDLPQAVREITHSQAFALHWSDQLIKAWFAQGGLPLDDPRIKSAKEQVADFIGSGQPFNRIAVELLGGEITLPVKEPAATAEVPSLTTTFVSALAGNSNHRLVNRIGSNFLDANLACVRCHEAGAVGLTNSKAISSAVTTQPESGSAVNRQEVYWSLVAMLQGIEVQGGNGRQRQAIDRQGQLLAANKPLVAYYDMLDGRLQAAQPRLPNGQAWEQVAGDGVAGDGVAGNGVAGNGVASGPREALAEWLSQSTAMDDATVNQVWKIVYGRPLVEQVVMQVADSTEQVAANAQRELQLFLAGQYRSHGHDLKRLVGWVVLSDAFGRTPQELTHAQWLDAHDEELRQLQLAELTFATGPRSAPTKEAASLENSLATVLKWKGESVMGNGNASEATLAQPAPKLPTTGKKDRQQPSQRQTSGGFPSPGYALYGQQPTPQHSQFVSRLLASQRLSWEQCVEHIVLLDSDNALGGRIQHLSDELLRQHRGDARAALLDLLWAVKNSDVM